MAERGEEVQAQHEHDDKTGNGLGDRGAHLQDAAADGCDIAGIRDEILHLGNTVGHGAAEILPQPGEPLRTLHVGDEPRCILEELHDLPNHLRHDEQQNSDDDEGERDVDDDDRECPRYTPAFQQRHDGVETQRCEEGEHDRDHHGRQVRHRKPEDDGGKGSEREQEAEGERVRQRPPGCEGSVGRDATARCRPAATNT